MSFDITRSVIVHCTNGERLFGFIPKGMPLDTYFQTSLKADGFVKLLNVRNLVVQTSPRQGPRGEITGLQTFAALMPVDILPGPIESMNIVPSNWYFPMEEGASLDKFERLISAAEDNEIANRAADSGISVPGRA